MSASLWQSHDVMTALKGQALGQEQWQAHSVSIDSRSIEKNGLFVAIVGEHMDGHHYVVDALKKGAAAAIVHYVPENYQESDGALVLVEDSFEALQQLAAAARARFDGKVIGVTGSVGKTTTKEMIAQMLSEQGVAYATKGNLNNHYGVPLTLANMPAEADYAVIEMGMNHPGEISPLSALSQPDVALITTVEAVHIEFFNSLHDIAEAKCEIFDGLSPEGTAIIFRDHPLFTFMQKQIAQRGLTQVRSFGEHAESDLQLKNAKLTAAGTEIEIAYQGKDYHMCLGMLGHHHALNVAAALSVVVAVGADIARAIKCLPKIKEAAGRGRRYQLQLPQGTVILIDESYNASPAAVAASIEVLGAIGKHHAGRKIALLADMLELGDEAVSHHENLAKNILENNIDMVCTVGSLMRHLYDALPQDRARHCDNAKEALACIEPELKDNDIILIKGSHSMNMHDVVEYLTGHFSHNVI